MSNIIINKQHNCVAQYCPKFMEMSQTMSWVVDLLKLLWNPYFSSQKAGEPHNSLLLSPHHGPPGRNADKPLFNKVTKRIT